MSDGRPRSDHQMASGRFEIKNKGMKIVGITESPSSVPAPAVVLMHGYSGDKDEHGRFADASKRLVAMGFAAIRFDFRYGKTPENGSESEGELSEMTPDQWVSDAKVVLSYASSLPEVDAQRIGVVGLSMGGYTAICAAARSKLAKAVVSWSAPAELRSGLRSSRGQHRRKFMRVSRLYVPLRDCRRIAPRPFLAVAGTKDTVVKYKNAVRLFEAAREPKSLYLIGGADHVFSEHQSELLDVTLGWLSEKLGQSSIS